MTRHRWKGTLYLRCIIISLCLCLGRIGCGCILWIIHSCLSVLFRIGTRGLDKCCPWSFKGILSIVSFSRIYLLFYLYAPYTHPLFYQSTLKSTTQWSFSSDSLVHEVSAIPVLLSAHFCGIIQFCCRT